jgi:hypothetical protein
MKKLISLGIICLGFFSCTTNIENYSLTNIQYPEWINSEYPNWMNEDEKNIVEYNHTSFFVLKSRTFGANYSELSLLINPKINWDNLYILEISFVKDGEKTYFVQNKNIKNKRRMFTHLMNIKFKDLPKYFKNIESNEPVEVQLTQIYKFDDNQQIIEIVPYKIECFNHTYNPLDKFYWGP